MSTNQILIVTFTNLGAVFMVILAGLLIFNYYAPRKNRSPYKQSITNAELAMENDLKYWAKRNRAKVIPPALYKYRDSMFFKIDSILITKYCVVIVKFQLTPGDVQGNGTASHLETTIGDHKYRLLNPIKSNDMNIEHFQNMIKTNFPLISLIIFFDQTNSIKIHEIPDHVLVTTRKKLFFNLQLMLDAIQKLDPKHKDAMEALFYNIKLHITKSTREIKQFNALNVENNKVMKIEEEITEK